MVKEKPGSAARRQNRKRIYNVKMMLWTFLILIQMLVVNRLDIRKASACNVSPGQWSSHLLLPVICVGAAVFLLSLLLLLLVYLVKVIYTCYNEKQDKH